MSPEQCKAARALLGWSQEALAELSGVSVSTIRNFERGRSALMPANQRSVEEAFSKANIEFLPGGVRRR